MGFYSEKVEELTPYVPGEQPKDGEYIKLNTNENPYSPSPKVEKAIQNFNFEKLKLYPDFECMSLRKTFAESVGVSSENVFVGNGSDEVLAIAFQAFFMNKENVLMPDISYSFYRKDRMVCYQGSLGDRQVCFRDNLIPAVFDSSCSRRTDIYRIADTYHRRYHLTFYNKTGII